MILHTVLLLLQLLLSNAAGITKKDFFSHYHYYDDDELHDPYSEDDGIFDTECFDARTECKQWVRERSCKDDYFVRSHCLKSCRACDTDYNTIQPPSNPRFYREDRDEDGALMTAVGAWITGEPQIWTDESLKDQIIDKVVRDYDEYFTQGVQQEPMYTSVKNLCRNKHALCTQRAIRGDCETNSTYMDKNCPVACRTCEKLNFSSRCYWDPYIVKNAWYPGELNQMFERIANGEGIAANYNVTVLSKPNYDETRDTNVEEQTDFGGPWIIMIDDFLTTVETDTLIKWGAELGYERSTDVGEELEDGQVDKVVSKGRTSKNAWCNGQCGEDPLVVRIWDRMEELTGINADNSESLQLLKYEVGEYYNEHHDYVGLERDRMGGVRILTIFMYLNDVPEGGETEFTQLNAYNLQDAHFDSVKVEPKRGRAILWPSVLDETPHDRDDRTFHRALSVLKGVKYGANAWFHQRNFEEAVSIGC